MKISTGDDSALPRRNHRRHSLPLRLRVTLRSGQIKMPQKHLNVDQLRAGFEQAGGVGRASFVWHHHVADASLLDKAAQIDPHRRRAWALVIGFFGEH
jgi:hypothetical protein